MSKKRRYGYAGNKFGVAPKAQRTVDGITFDSKKEMTRYLDLKAMERAGVITNLALQTRFPLIVNGTKICTYVSDFDYDENGEYVVEDVKGVKTSVYRLKKKLFELQYRMKIKET